MWPDLHVHTNYSDADVSPAEVLRLAKEAGVPGVAVCDHDECRAYGEMKDSDGIAVYSGIELGAVYDSSLHVLGLMIDWQNEALIRYCDEAARDRRTRAEKMLDRFKAAKVPLTMNDVKAQCEGCVIGRPHFAAALVAKGLASSMKEAFQRYLSRNACCYVPNKKVDVEHAAALILEAGGKPVLAHPGLVRGTTAAKLVPRLKAMGFWGVEAYHSAHSDGQCREYVSLARQHGLYVTCGSDFHGSVKPKIHIGQEQRGGAYLRESMDALGVLDQI